MSVVVSEHKQDVGDGYIWAVSKYPIKEEPITNIQWTLIVMILVWSRIRAQTKVLVAGIYGLLGQRWNFSNVLHKQDAQFHSCHSMSVLFIRIIMSTRLYMGMTAEQIYLKI